MSRNSENVEVEGNRSAALAPKGETLVDIADEIGCALVGPNNRLIGHQASCLLGALDSEAEGDDAAAVAAFTGGARHTVGRFAQELDPGVVVDHGLDVERERTLFAFSFAQKPDA